MSDMTCPTVKVKSVDPDLQGPFVVINHSDYDATVHELIPEPLPLPPVPLPPVTSSPSDPLDAMVGDWQSFDPAMLRQVAASVSGRAVENKEQAIQVIQAELAKRGK